MTHSENLSHSVTSQLAVPAAFAFDFMRDPILLGHWAIGCMDTQETEVTGVYSGQSLFDGGKGWLSIEADEKRLIVDYHLGDLKIRQPRISARIIPQEVCNLAEGNCYVTLMAWRVRGMDDARWEVLRKSHEAEILLIKAQCEARFNGKHPRL